jgi:hypothetical protein
MNKKNSACIRLILKLHAHATKGWWAGPDLNRRSSPREGDVLTELDYRPLDMLSEKNLW